MHSAIGTHTMILSSSNQSLSLPTIYWNSKSTFLLRLQIAMAVHMNWPVCSDLPHLPRLFESF